MDHYNNDNELRILYEKRNRKTRVKAMLSDLKKRLEDLKVQEQRLLKAYADEQADVERLEKPSLATLFYALANRKEEKLDKEKAEAYAAAVKHKAAVAQIEATEQDIRALDAELSELAGIEARYDEAFAQKEAAIKASDPEHAAELCRIEDRLQFVSAQIKETEEALSVGKSVLSRISAIQGELDSAEGWGTWDLLGGGLLTDLAKHSHLDDAQARINDLQVMLGRYRTELADVTVEADIQAQIEGFLRFADYFFDGLFADWAVLDSIHNSQEQIADTCAQVVRVQNQLEKMKQSFAAEMERLKVQINELVLKA